MNPDHINMLDKLASAAMVLIPALLLAVKSVRSLLAKVIYWAWKPISSQFARRDKVLSSIEEKVEAIMNQLSVMSGTMQLQADAAEDVGFFQCDHEGRNTHVNQTYCRWMRCTPSQLLDWGFLGFIHPAQREAVRAEWLACIRDHRDYRTRFRMGSPEHGYREYDVIARPIPNHPPPAIAWVGAVRLIHRRIDDVEAGQPASDWRHETGV